jgi:hypothetical protein
MTIAEGLCSVDDDTHRPLGMPASDRVPIEHAPGISRKKFVCGIDSGRPGRLIWEGGTGGVSPPRGGPREEILGFVLQAKLRGGPDAGGS